MDGYLVGRNRSVRNSKSVEKGEKEEEKEEEEEGGGGKRIGSINAIYRDGGDGCVGRENGSAESIRRARDPARHGNSFADKFRQPKHRSQCSILLIGVFVGGIRFNSRMR